jgi:hypothetical protein
MKQTISQSDKKALSRIMSKFGRRAAGVPKTMSPAAIAQRKAAGIASARKRKILDSKLAQSKPRRRKILDGKLAQTRTRK